MRIKGWPAAGLLASFRPVYSGQPQQLNFDVSGPLVRRTDRPHKEGPSCTRARSSSNAGTAFFALSPVRVSRPLFDGLGVTAGTRPGQGIDSSSTLLSLRHVHRKLALDRPIAVTSVMGVVVPSADDGGGGGSSSSLFGQAAGGISLWLDMRTAVLPATQTLQHLYTDLRRREEALGRSPDDPDWTLKRVPNPVGALLYAPEPEGRAAEEMKTLGGTLPCFQLNDDDRVLDVSSGEVVGVGLDPADGGRGGQGAIAICAEAQQAEANTSKSSVVLLRGVRPSNWAESDMPNVLQIAAGACTGSGKTLVVSIRSVGQLHDAAMAALAASQIQVLGRQGGVEGGVALLIEPTADLWEAGLSYL